MTLITWILTVLSIIGVILNTRKKVSGFYFWGITNICWMIINADQGQNAQAVLFGFYFLMSLYGVWAWGKDATANSAKGKTSE